MHCFRIVLLALALSAGTIAAEDRGDSLAEASLAGHATLKVLFVASEGWADVDEQGHLSGVTVEIMQGFATHMSSEYGIEVDLEFVEEPDWTVFYGRVRDASGGVFGLGNVTITEARRKELAFSPPYVDNVAVLITHEDVPVAASPTEAAEAMAGLRALAFAGTLHEQRIEALRDDYWPELAIDRTTSNDEIIERVAAGEHFAWIDGYNYFRARERGAPIRRHPALDDPGEQFGIIMPLDNDWQAPLAGYLAGEEGLIGSDRYRQLLARHLGQGVADLLTE